MDDALKVLREAGFTPTLNVDEDFPALEGEYAVTVSALRPWVNEETDQKEAYMLQLKVSQTLSGEMGDGRLFTRFYRIAGADFEGNAITPVQVAEALKRFSNDLFTLGVTLDLSTSEALEASFATALDATGYVRAWKQTWKDRQKVTQAFRIKQEKDLRKTSVDAKDGRTERAPF